MSPTSSTAPNSPAASSSAPSSAAVSSAPTPAAPSSVDPSTALSPEALTAPGEALAHAPGAPLLELEHLHHRWKGPKPPVLEDVSLTLRAGEVTWIGGRNGVGKTTLLRLAAGSCCHSRAACAWASSRPARREGATGDRSASSRRATAAYRRACVCTTVRLLGPPRLRPPRAPRRAGGAQPGAIRPRGASRAARRPDVDGPASAPAPGDGVPARAARGAAGRAAQLARRRRLRAAQRADPARGGRRRHRAVVLTAGRGPCDRLRRQLHAAGRPLGACRI